MSTSGEAAAPRVRWRTRYAVADWALFALFVVVSAAAFAALAWGLRADERLAARGRAEAIARALALELAQDALSPGTDIVDALPSLARAGGPLVQLAIAEQPGDGPFSLQARRRFLAHSAPARTGTALDPASSEDRWAQELLQLVRWRDDGGRVSIEWQDGRVAAVALAKGRPRLAALVRGVSPEPGSGRPWRMALVGWVLLVVFAAGLHDMLPKVGKFLNALAFLLAAAALGALGVALAPAYWRGETTLPLVAEASALGFAELARSLSADLPPAASTIPARAGPVFAVAWIAYALGLAGVWAHVLARMARERFAYTVAAPATLALLLLVGAPAAFALFLSFCRVGPGELEWIGPANYALILSDPVLASPTAAWWPLAMTVLVALAALVLQVVPGVLLAFALRRLGRAAGMLLPLFSLAWALPAFVTAQALASSATLTDPLSTDGPSWVLLVAAAAAWSGLPLVALVVHAGLVSLPIEVEEAARLDGVPRTARLRHLVYPLLRPVLARVAAIAVVGAANGVVLHRALVPRVPEAIHDTVASRSFSWAFERFELGDAAAWAFVGLVVSLVLALPALRRARPLAEGP